MRWGEGGRGEERGEVGRVLSSGRVGLTYGCVRAQGWTKTPSEHASGICHGWRRASVKTLDWWLQTALQQTHHLLTARQGCVFDNANKACLFPLKHGARWHHTAIRRKENGRVSAIRDGGRDKAACLWQLTQAYERRPKSFSSGCIAHDVRPKLRENKQAMELTPLAHCQYLMESRGIAAVAQSPSVSSQAHPCCCDCTLSPSV